MESLFELLSIYIDVEEQVTNLGLAFADDAASYGYTFSAHIVGYVPGALGSITLAIALAQTGRIYMAFVAEKCVGAAPEGSCITAEVTFVLNVAQAVHSTHKILVLVHFLQSAGLALNGVMVHKLFLSILDFLLNCAIDVSTEERLLTSCALVEFTHTEGKF